MRRSVHLFRRRGFSAIELVVIIAAVLILGVVGIVRLRDARADAQAAKDRANVALIQGVYERAKLLHPEATTNQTVSTFIWAAYRQGLLNTMLASNDLERIRLAGGTSIPGHNALFVLGTNTVESSGGLTNDRPAPPIVTITSPAPGSSFLTGQPILLAYTPTAANDVITKTEARFDGELLATRFEPPFALTIPMPSAGNHAFQVKAYNSWGQVGMAEVAVFGTINSRPVIALSGPSGTHLFSNPLSFTANASDPNTGAGDQVSRVELWVNDNLVQSAPASSHTFNWTSPAAGSYTVAARAYDSFGLSEDSVPLALNLIANYPPTVSLSPLNTSLSYYPQVVTFTADATDSDGIARVEFFVDGAPRATNTTAPYAFSWTASAGSHTIIAMAFDSFGDSAQASATATVADNRSPNVAFTTPVNGASLSVNTGSYYPVTISVDDSDAGDRVADLAVYDGSELISSQSNPGSTYSFNTYPVSGGTRTLTAVARDTRDAYATNSISVTINLNHAPNITLTPSNNASVAQSQPFSLTATVTDPDGDPIAQVDFYVGSTKIATDTTGPFTASYTPATAGNISIKAVAFDSRGMSNSTPNQTIMVVGPTTITWVERTHMYPPSGTYYDATFDFYQGNYADMISSQSFSYNGYVSLGAVNFLRVIPNPGGFGLYGRAQNDVHADALSNKGSDCYLIAWGSESAIYARWSGTTSTVMSSPKDGDDVRIAVINGQTQVQVWRAGSKIAWLNGPNIGANTVRAKWEFFGPHSADLGPMRIMTR